MILTKGEKRTLFYFMRHGIYLMCLLGAGLLMWHLAGIYHLETFEEYSVVENMQMVILAVSALLFMGLAWQKTSYRSLFILFSGMCALATCRELDEFLDRHIPVFGWEIAFLFVVPGLWYIIRHFRDFRKDLVSFCGSSMFHLMFMAMVIVGPIAQVIGHKQFFIDALGPTCTDPRLVRRLFEESIELLGYILIFLSAVESYIYLIDLHKKHK